MNYIVQIIVRDYLEIEKFRDMVDIGNLNKDRHKIKFKCNDLITLFEYIYKKNITYKSLKVTHV